MPIYDFKCRECGEHFEALVLKTAPACPGCQSANLEQLISMFGVSSESTRQSNMKDARIKGEKNRRDWQMAQAEYERDHRH